MQNKLGSELEFISRINRDGSGTVDVSKESAQALQNTSFRMSSLSITNGTHIACEFNSYVVKIK